MNTSSITAKQTNPTFCVYSTNKENKSTGALKPHILYCFISTFILDASKPLPEQVKAADGKIYMAVYDNFHLPPPHKDQNIRAIGSFQKHTDSSQYVVIKNFIER